MARKRWLNKILAWVVCLVIAVTSSNIENIYYCGMKNAKAASNFDLPDTYPATGQKYWVIFQEGYRDSRIEMTTCDVKGNSQDIWIEWDRGLYLRGGEADEGYNQYCLDEKAWKQIGTYHLFTDYATSVIASNLDIYNTDGELVLEKTNLYESNSSLNKRENALEAYSKMLSANQLTFYLDAENSIKINASDCKFAVVDVDSDFVPELVIQGGEGTYHSTGYFNLFTYKDGGIQFVYNTSDDFLYIENSGIFVWNYTGMGTCTYEYYNMLDNAVNKVLIKGGLYNDATDAFDWTYHKGDGSIYEGTATEISESEFQKCLNDFGNGKSEQRPIFYENTAGNRNKYLGGVVYDNATQKVDTLIKNTKGLENPLVEYRDPENLFCGYPVSLGIQAGVYLYGNEFSKDDMWVKGYERCLDDMLAEDNVYKMFSSCNISGLAENVKNTKETIDIMVTNKLSTMIKPTNGIDLVNVLKVSDSLVKAKLQYCYESIAVICQIIDNTNNENLKEACRVVMYDRYTFVVNEIEDIITECLAENGIVLIEQNAELLGQLLAEYVAIGAGEIATLIACSAEALSYVKLIVVVKDLISDFTGLKKRAENYIDAICLNTIYFAAAGSYNSSLEKIDMGQYETEDIDNIISMFEFILKVKQKQYDCMGKMFTSDKFKKIKAEDKYIDQHIKSLKKITIENYDKAALKKLNPSIIMKSSLKKGKTSNIEVNDLAYKSKVTYKSKNKKIAKVNSSGKITAKNIGATKIVIKIEQYGETLEYEKNVKINK